jgi:type I restriction enzyme M protein
VDHYLKEKYDDYYAEGVNADFQRNQALTGCELVRDTHRLALMNAMLHNINSPIYLGDTLSSYGEKLKGYDLVLTNPPFGTKRGGERPTRTDLTYKSSNKQLNFLQHIYRSLKNNGKARAAVVLPDNVLFQDGDGVKVRKDLLNKCNLHTILRLPIGIFYAQGVKTNVLFFTRGKTEENNTQEVWYYDLRTNMPSFGKTNPLKEYHFKEFIKAFKAKDRSKLQKDRWNRFTIDDISGKGYTLDLGLIADEKNGNSDNLHEPKEIAEMAFSELESIIEDLKEIINEFEK